MSIHSPRNRFIVNVRSPASDDALIESLQELGLAVDLEYGVVRLDVSGAQRVVRVDATEAQVEQAQSTIDLNYFPDLTIARQKP